MIAKVDPQQRDGAHAHRQPAPRRASPSRRPWRSTSATAARSTSACRSSRPWRTRATTKIATGATSYGDEALDACEDLCGVRTARDLRRLLRARGSGSSWACSSRTCASSLVPGRERGYRVPRDARPALRRGDGHHGHRVALARRRARDPRGERARALLRPAPTARPRRHLRVLRRAARDRSRGARRRRSPRSTTLLQALREPALLPRAPARHAAPLRHGRALRPRGVRASVARTAAPRSRAPTRSTRRASSSTR